jgi:uncharacterized membrane protein
MRGEIGLQCVLMTVLVFCFFLGCVAGLRSLTAPAAVCWAAHLGWLHFAGTKLAFLAHPATLSIFTLPALLELITAAENARAHCASRFNRAHSL